jgi:hypothetical protein
MFNDYFSQVPEDFRLSIKVTEEVTVKRFSTLPRYGKRAGQINERFLDADLFVGSFLAPLEPYRAQMGALSLNSLNSIPAIGRGAVSSWRRWTGSSPCYRKGGITRLRSVIRIYSIRNTSRCGGSTGWLIPLTVGRECLGIRTAPYAGQLHR